MKIYQQIEHLLNQEFAPTLLEIIDTSHRHQGHIAAGSAIESHFNIKLISKHFEGLTVFERHKKVITILSPLMQDAVHSFSLKLYSH